MTSFEPIVPEETEVRAADDVLLPQLTAHTAESQAPPSVEQVQTAEDMFLAAQQQGFQVGIDLARQQVQLSLQTLTAAMDSYRGVLAVRTSQLEEDAARLAHDLAVALLRSELSIHPGQVLGVVRGALDRVSEGEEVHLHLHPEDRQIIGDDARALEQSGARLHLHDDPALTRGGCRVTSDVGDVDATVEGRVQKLTDRLNDLHAQHQADADAVR